MMRSFLWLGCLAGVSLALVGCGGSEKTPSTATPATTIAPKPPVAVTPPAPIAVAPPPAAQAAVAAAPTPPPSPESPAEPPARSLGEAIVRQLPAADCDRARASWKDAAQSADDLAGALTRCLRAGSYRCRDASAALAPALTALEWAEQQVDDGCP